MEKKFYVKNGKKIVIYILSINEYNLYGIANSLVEYDKIQDLLFNLLESKNSLDVSEAIYGLVNYNSSDLNENFTLKNILKTFSFEKFDIVTIGVKNRQKYLDKCYLQSYKSDKRKIKGKHKLPFLDSLNTK